LINKHNESSDEKDKIIAFNSNKLLEHQAFIDSQNKTIQYHLNTVKEKEEQIKLFEKQLNSNENISNELNRVKEKDQ